MENTDQYSFKPLSSNFGTDKVLFLNTEAPRLDIIDAANLRFTAAKDLISTIACMTIQDMPDNSITPICQAAHLLLSDAWDLLQVGIYKKGVGDE
ncbi:MAG: hypothetical protein B0W54_19425 [Cellvibrio sp. 79]|nr:MAG: hypothetical protein B0W54_19425 [Cellvibrio sp. 79]